MKEVTVAEVEAKPGQVREWLLSHRLEHLSVLAGMHPEQRFTLAKNLRPLEASADAGLRFAVDAERTAFTEVDGQMEPSRDRVPMAVVFEVHDAGGEVVRIRVLAMQGSGVDRHLEDWIRRQIQRIDDAFSLQDPPQDQNPA